MSFYNDSEYPVTNEIAKIHETQINSMGESGTWGTGTQRLAIAKIARVAGYKVGVLEKTSTENLSDNSHLPNAVTNIVKHIAITPKDLDKKFYDKAMNDGISDGEYVEIVGIVSRLTSLDVFARGIGVPLRNLPNAQKKAPTRVRPIEAIKELAWAPTIPNGAEGGELGNNLYGNMPKPYIVRALSMVPDELKAHMELEKVQYSRMDKVLDFSYTHHKGLNRSQVELVAGRISAINECFF